MVRDREPDTRLNRSRRRRAVTDRVGGALLLPAQGGWLAFALERGGDWWAVWAVVLGILIASVVLVVVQERRRPPERRPVSVSPLLLVVASAIVGWVVLAIVL
jgi:bacteriorhodopsin